ncbi:ALP_N domain-containing protein [Candidatus Hydrogenisulfobacillus filiaventi]|uniref:ALP_N domain-containing protein n=1 Tax=Candidatus Hydrogenisulfobacillus filiaventi TaxID=2707344 RepID=A0A6F8ZIS6_9FIRM|nr:ALP_N domain-containing protein [Candidatus Hydrogenisulfobacillus filiaventi]
MDLGHGWVKAMTGDRRVLFPALMAPADTAAVADWGDVDGDRPVLINGAPKWIGEPARWHDGAPLWSRDKAQDADSVEMVLVALAALQLAGPVRVAIGLPLGWWATHRAELAMAWKGRSAVVRWPGQEPLRPVIEDVLVLPQGIAAASLLATSTYPPGPWLVVDVGYRTTEYVLAIKEPSGQLRYNTSKAGSVELGMARVWTQVADELSREARAPFTAAEVEGRDEVFVRGRSWPLADRIARASENLTVHLRRSLAPILDDALLKARGVLLVGGGAGALAAHWPEALLPADPQWANAEAYWAALVTRPDGK